MPTIYLIREQETPLTKRITAMFAPTVVLPPTSVVHVNWTDVVVNCSPAYVTILRQTERGVERYCTAHDFSLADQKERSPYMKALAGLTTTWRRFRDIGCAPATLDTLCSVGLADRRHGRPIQYRLACPRRH